MKLLNHTTSYFAALLFILLAIWAILFYYQMLDEIYDSIDDGLENQKILVMQQASANNAILNKTSFEEGNYTINKVQFHQFKNFTESYRDTLMYMQNEEDYEPVRLLESVFRLDGSFYKIKVITSMVEEDDLVEDLLLSLIWLYLGLIASILILNNLILKKIWNPFYILLDQLKNFKIQDKKKPQFQASAIDEFNLLNSRLEKFIVKAQESYQNQKEFIENASHEMQTPLAIAINNLERLMESQGLNRDQMETIEKTLKKMESLARFNQSLLLLSKIKNNQFIEGEKIHINLVLKNLIEDFSDLISHKNLQINFEENAQLYYVINAELAQILLTNFLKNALVYTPENEMVRIEVGTYSVVFINSGDSALDASRIFKRFFYVNHSASSNGLGLAIAKAIAEIYSLQLEYSFQDGHKFSIIFK